MALKFKRDDKVRVVSGWDIVNGCTGVIAIADEDATFPYNVTLDELPAAITNAASVYNWLMDEDELELV